MKLDKNKYDEYVETHVRPIIDEHNLFSHKADFALHKVLSFVSSGLDSYKGDRKKVAKEVIFSQLLKFFGGFEFKRDQILPFQYLHNSMIIPEHTGYAAEDRITGIFNNTKIDISEVALINQVDKKNISAFKGLVIILDVCNPELVLRGPFKGTTVVIADHKKHIDYIKNKFKDYTRMEPPIKNLEDRFEMYTTNANEANTFICERLMKSFMDLSDYITSLNDQITHKDDAFEISFKQKINDVVIKLFEEEKLWWEKQTNEVSNIKDAKLSEIYKENPIYGTSEMESLNNDIACSFYNDKVLLTIPHAHDLFEPNPLHEAPIVEEDIELIYYLMNAVFEITNIIIENKSSTR